MFIEHIFYSGAIAILIGMLFYKYTGRDSSWIIIICAWAPDLDELDDLLDPVFRYVGTKLFQHGTFHNFAFMVLFGIAIAFLLLPLGIRFFDSLFFAMVGFGAHLLEDWLVYKPGYMFLWPFSTKILGFGLLPKMINGKSFTTNFFHLANSEVLIIGLLLLCVAILIRTYFEKSSSWIRWYMPEKLYQKLSGK